MAALYLPYLYSFLSLTGRQHQGKDRPAVRQVSESIGEQGKWRKYVEVICGAPATLAVKELMMMLMMISPYYRHG